MPATSTPGSQPPTYAGSSPTSSSSASSGSSPAPKQAATNGQESYPPNAKDARMSFSTNQPKLCNSSIGHIIAYHGYIAFSPTTSTLLCLKVSMTRLSILSPSHRVLTVRVERYFLRRRHIAPRRSGGRKSVSLMWWCCVRGTSRISHGWAMSTPGRRSVMCGVCAGMRICQWGISGFCDLAWVSDIPFTATSRRGRAIGMSPSPKNVPLVEFMEIQALNAVTI